MQGLTEGRNVHYVDYDGRHLASLVIGHDGSQTGQHSDTGIADLVVFSSRRNRRENLHTITPLGPEAKVHLNVPYSDTPSAGTWHFIEPA